MAINGIELAVGQRWVTRGGMEVEITAHDQSWAPLQWVVVSVAKRGDPGFQWHVGGYGHFMGQTGPFRFEPNNDLHSLDLVRLVSVAPQAPAAALPPSVVTAPAILDAAAAHMRDRAATYDKPEGERSMAQTVEIFNKFHGTGISETQGWHFMQILKDVRLFSNVVDPHRDSIDDGVAYAALKGESLLRGAQ